jgi:hypothetical protein
MSKPNGYVVWEGPSPVDGRPIVFIVTNLHSRSANVKTGEMVQSFILRTDVHPLAAIRSAEDASVCGHCPHRGRLSDDGMRMVDRSCYVDVAKSVAAVWSAYRRGSYPRVSPEVMGRMLAGDRVRLGAYGDPGMVPLSVLQAVMAECTGTGYTHQWRHIDLAYSSLVMASADSVEDRRAARSMGYRSFWVLPAHADSMPEGTVECASTRERAPRQCIDCLMCGGTRDGAVSGAVDVAILAHGSGAKFVR